MVGLNETDVRNWKVKIVVLLQTNLITNKEHWKKTTENPLYSYFILKSLIVTKILFEMKNKLFLLRNILKKETTPQAR